MAGRNDDDDPRWYVPPHRNLGHGLHGRDGVRPPRVPAPPLFLAPSQPETPGQRRIRRIALGVTAAGAISAFAWDGGWFSAKPNCDPSDPMAAAEPECRDRKDGANRSGGHGSGGGYHAYSGGGSTSTPTSSVHFGGFGKTGAAFHGGGS